MSKKLDDFRLRVAGKELVPLVIGGMGVNISTTQLALEAARLGGVGHISDAMMPAVADDVHGTRFVSEKLKRHRRNVKQPDKSGVLFQLAQVAEATRLYVTKTMERKQGPGLIFLNCMEKLSMGNPKDTLQARLKAALDAGIDGITLSAGLYLASFALLADHPRFRDALLGIIVSSVRALKLFLKRAARVNRPPDYVVVEGPLAGGHLGFGLDWKKFDLKAIFQEVVQYLKKEGLPIPVIPAGGIFTGTDAVEYMEAGAGAVQVATRFTVTRESGLPEDVKQRYFEAEEQDIEVNMLSPTGYPMRMLKNCPAVSRRVRPACEAYGYLLDGTGRCSYLETYYQAAQNGGADKLHEIQKVCLCTHMRRYQCWTCGHYTYRLKETTRRNPDGTYQILSAEHVFKDYQFSTDHEIALPEDREP
jgi:nitronate monooxygenase